MKSLVRGRSIDDCRWPVDDCTDDDAEETRRRCPERIVLTSNHYSEKVHYSQISARTTWFVLLLLQQPSIVSPHDSICLLARVPEGCDGTSQRWIYCTSASRWHRTDQTRVIVSSIRGQTQNAFGVQQQQQYQLHSAGWKQTQRDWIPLANEWTPSKCGSPSSRVFWTILFSFCQGISSTHWHQTIQSPLSKIRGNVSL